MQDGERRPNHETMAAKLLNDNVLFILNVSRKDEQCAAAMVNVSDVFKREFDFEPISRHEIPDLFRLYEEDDYNGVIKWAAIKRGLKPMAHIEESLTADDFWDSTLEKLKKNRNK